MAILRLSISKQDKQNIDLLKKFVPGEPVAKPCIVLPYSEIGNERAIDG